MYFNPTFLMILKSNSQYVPTHAELNIYHKLFSFRFLLSGDHLFPLLGILSLPCPDLHYATTSALVALLPLQHCGKEEGDDEVGGEDLLQRVVSEAFPEQGGRLQREGEGLLGELGVDEGAGIYRTVLLVGTHNNYSRSFWPSSQECRYDVRFFSQ